MASLPEKEVLRTLGKEELIELLLRVAGGTKSSVAAAAAAAGSSPSPSSRSLASGDDSKSAAESAALQKDAVPTKRVILLDGERSVRGRPASFVLPFSSHLP
jgi:hypothetical protein